MSTSAPTPLQTIRALVDSLPMAALVADRDGTVLHCNPHARRVLLPAKAQDSLSRLFEHPGRVRETLRMASSSSGTTPAGVTVRETGKKFRANLSMLMLEPGKPSGFLLVSLQEREYANHRLMALSDRLDVATERRRLLEEKNRELRDTIEKRLPALREQSRRDALTGLYNRGYFDARLVKEWHRAIRESSEISLIFCDIDDFKALNDFHGHVRGDECLIAVATVIKESIEREFDFAARIGGEEFALVLPMTNTGGAGLVARRLLCNIRDRRIPREDGDVGIVTLSCGVATASPCSDRDPLELVEAADKAMYAAKRRGKNQHAFAAGVLRPTGVAAAS